VLKHLQSSEDWNQKSIGAKGFTLIELLVVIVILGILAAVVVFAVSGIQDKGQKSACLTEARTVRTAQESYYAQSGSYALSLSGSPLIPKYLSKAPTLVKLGSGNTAQNLDLEWDGTTCTATNTGQATP
jgi:prepilin-type N-terminal cleavage/methylation domain-containing protein